MDDAEVLAGLDFQPEAQQCECDSCAYHPGRCPGVATHCVRIHVFGACNHPSLAATNGFVSRFLCDRCTHARAHRVAELFNDSHRALNIYGTYLHCVSCRKALQQVNDFWEARPING